MKFLYQAKSRSGELSTGEIDAASIVEARQQLRGRGLFVSKLAPAGSAGQAKQAGMSLRLFGRVTKSDLVMVLSQLSIMCQSGIDLAEALGNAAEQCKKPAFRTVLERVHADVSGGAAFSDALRRHPHVFDEMFVAGIASGEQSGTITQVLERLTYLLRGDLRLQSTVWSMLMYPMILSGVTFVVLNALVFFVLPQFATVFDTLEKPVPPLTRFLLDIGSCVRSHLVLVIGSFFGLVIGAAMSRNAPVVRRAWDYATLNMAMVKTATRALLTGRTLRMLGTMLMSGVPLVDGIRLCRSASRNQFFRDLFVKVENDVLNGEGLGRTLFAAPFLPAGAAQMVATAEKSGKMGEVIKSVGEYYEDQGETALRNLVKIAEPAVIVFLGVFVAGIVLSIVLPMLDVSTSSGR